MDKTERITDRRQTVDPEAPKTLKEKEKQELVRAYVGFSCRVQLWVLSENIKRVRASPRTALYLLSLHFLGCAVGAMCNTDRHVTVVDLTTSFLCPLTSHVSSADV